MRQQSSGLTVAVVGSMTMALGAQHALAKGAIRSDIVKQDSGQRAATGTRGCSYGVAFPTTHKANATAILATANIRARYFDGDGWQLI